MNASVRIELRLVAPADRRSGRHSRRRAAELAREIVRELADRDAAEQRSARELELELGLHDRLELECGERIHAEVGQRGFGSSVGRVVQHGGERRAQVGFDRGHAIRSRAELARDRCADRAAGTGQD